MSEKQPGPTQGVRLKEESFFREFSYSKMTEKRPGPKQGVHL